MPKSVDSNIYGIDLNSFAEGVASDALKDTAGAEDYWGGKTDPRANSWDVDKEPQPGDVETLPTTKAGAGSDGKMDWEYDKALPRHRVVRPSPDESTFVAPKRFSGKR